MEFRKHSRFRSVREIRFDALHETVQVFAFIQKAESFGKSDFSNNIKLRQFPSDKDNTA